jgi:Tol biopolymer transport system component/DNA-binding winged helix-turn-helix (wHTH) protein
VPERPAVRFGPFELTRETGELRKHGLRLRLQEQPLQVLTALLDRRGELVTREELIKVLWPDGTFVDFDKGLNSAVTRLRQVLADSAEDPRYIETVARRGYRFIAPVESLTPAEPVRAAVIQRPAPAPRMRTRLIVLWAGVAVVAAIAIVILTIRVTGQEFHEPYTALPLTRLPGNERDPSFSPDGRELVFAWDGGNDGPFKLFAKRIGSETLLSLTKGIGDDRSPAWSPDGNSIAFLRRYPERMSLMIVPALGGPERTLIDMPRGEGADEIYTVSYLCWSSDGNWIVYSDFNSSTRHAGLSAFAPGTGDRRTLTQPAAATLGDFSPALSPDSRTLSFVRLAGIGDGDLYVMALAAGLKSRGAPERIPINGTGFSNVVWTGDGRRLLFPLFANGIGRVYLITPAKPGRLDPLVSLGEDARYVAISAQAKRLAISRERMDDNIWRLDVTRTRVGPQRNAHIAAQPVIVSTWSDLLPQYSPDGTKIAFNSDRMGSSGIWVSNSDGSEPTQVASHRSQMSGCAHWSPDGRQLAFHRRVNAIAEIYILELSTATVRQLTSDNGENSCASWSRDGRWVYFGSRRTGQAEVWKAPSGGGIPVQVTQHGGRFPLESFDGRHLYYAKPASSDLWRMPTDGGDEERIVALSKVYNWTIGRQCVWFIGRDPRGGGHVLNLLRLSTGAIEQVAAIAKPPGIGMTVSPDERSVLYTQVDRRESDLMLVENFPK